MANSDGHLPHNIEAEQAVLGSMLIDPRAIDRIIPLLSPSDFYLTQHADIYRAMVRVHDRGEPTDIIMVTNEYDPTMGDGMAYLASLGNLVPTSINAEHYARLVERHAVLRRLVDAGTRIQAIGYDDRYEASEALDEVDRMLKEARGAVPAPEWEQSEAWLDGLMARLSGPVTEDQSGIPTGLSPLDAILKGGLRRGNLIILGARPGVGKTSISATIAYYVAVHLNLPVLFFSVEMTRDEMGEKLLTIGSGVPWDTVTSHRWMPDEAVRLSQAAAKLRAAPLDIVPALEWTTDQIRQAARVVHQRRPLSLIVVDYLQEMEPSGKRENRTQDVGAMASAMKKMAMELNVPALVPAQLNRLSEQHANTPPKMSELRESGQIEAVANVVLLLHLPDEERNDDAEMVTMTVIVEKNRMGRRGKVRLGFRQKHMQFVSLADPSRQPSPIKRIFGSKDEEAAF